MFAADGKPSFDELMRLSLQSADVSRDCSCMIAGYRGWTRIPADFPQAQMRNLRPVETSRDKEGGVQDWIRRRFLHHVASWIWLANRGRSPE
jgi:hypothetical protein